MMSKAIGSVRGQERIFVDKAFRRFFFPSLLSNLSLALGGMVDCLVVGSKLGMDGLSAISLGIPVYLFYNLLSYGFSIGGSIHYASLMGAGKPKEANQVFGRVLRFLFIIYLMTAVLGIIFLPQLLGALGASPEYPGVYAIAERYVRAQLICVPIMFCQGPFYYFVHSDGAPKRAAVALTASNVVDIVLKCFFVLQFDMGAEGSVWSTAIGAVFCLAICGRHIIGKEGLLRFCWPSADPRGLISCIRTGFPSAVQHIYQFITVLCANNLLFSIGGPVGVAIFNVVYNLSQLFVAVTESTGMTLQPMISTYEAEGDRSAVKRTVFLSLCYGSALSLIVILGIGFGAAPLGTLFGLTDEASTIGSSALWIYCISILPALWNQIALYFLQTTRRERSALVIQTLRLFLCFTVLMYLLAPFGLTAFWWVFPLSELCTLCYTLILIKMNIKNKRLAIDSKESTIRYFSTCIQNAELLGDTVEELMRTCETWGCTNQQSYYTTLVVEELSAAILEDAKNNHRNDVLIKITVSADQDGFTLRLRDNSYEFNPFSAKEGEGPNALGMTIVRKKAKEFFYRRYQGFNTLIIIL